MCVSWMCVKKSRSRRFFDPLHGFRERRAIKIACYKLRCRACRKFAVTIRVFLEFDAFAKHETVRVHVLFARIVLLCFLWSFRVSMLLRMACPHTQLPFTSKAFASCAVQRLHNETLWHYHASSFTSKEGYSLPFKVKIIKQRLCMINDRLGSLCSNMSPTLLSGKLEYMTCGLWISLRIRLSRCRLKTSAKMGCDAHLSSYTRRTHITFVQSFVCHSLVEETIQTVLEYHHSILITTLMTHSWQSSRDIERRNSQENNSKTWLNRGWNKTQLIARQR